MKKGTKLGLAGVSLALLCGIVYWSIRYSRQGIVTVQTGRVFRQDLVAQATASGEIKPRHYVNIGADSIGRLTEILVKEGETVKKGQVLAKLETVQPAAEVSAQQAALQTVQAELLASTAAVKSAEENLRTVIAALQRARADGERADLNFQRAQRLLADLLIAKQDFDQRKAERDAAAAGVAEAEARVSQIAAQRDQVLAQRESARRRVDQVQATLTRASDVLQKHYSIAPLDGVVTNLPVRVGETVVPGLQNFAASLIMTIADMSLITAEVKVDETDIVNVKLHHAVEITIDAILNQVFRGRVIEIGNTAILRSSGLASSQSAISSREARDFKVIIALDRPPEAIRPGLSCTAKIITATRPRTLTIPIQALTVRTAASLTPATTDSGVARAANTAPAAPPSAQDPNKEDIQGVFVVAAGKAEFRKVATGITGASDIEVLDGLKESEEIILGPYKVLRTIRPETAVKVDNRTPGSEQQEGK